MATASAALYPVLNEVKGDVLIIAFNDAQIRTDFQMRQIGQALLDLVAKTKQTKLLLNFQEVEFMTSAMLHPLILFYSQCKAKQITVRMCHVSPRIQEVFKITQLHRVIKIHGNQDKALAAFGKWRFFFSLL